MQVIYKIGFNSTNFYFKNILDSLVKESKVNAQTKMYRGFILIICDDSNEKIEKFFKLMESKLPLSIFLTNAKVIENFDFEAYEELEDKNIKLNLTLFTNDEIKKILNENKIDFSNDINKIKEGGVSRFETGNGLKDFFLPNVSLREKFEKKGLKVKLLIINIQDLTNLVEISQKDLQLLCSIERPLVKLKFKLLQNAKGEYSNTRFIHAKIPDDKETLLFADALMNCGVNYLLYVDDDVYQEGLQVSYNENQNIIVHGEKGLFPKFDYQLNRKILSASDYFQEYGSVFKSALAQYNKRVEPAIGVYFSYQSDESAIKINVPTVGEKNVIHIPNVLSSVENCLDDIKSIDEHCDRLITNYKNKFPLFFEKEFINKECDGFGSILNLLSYLLGMKDYKQFEDTALTFNGKSGLQIDMKVVKVDDKNYLDYRRIIQSTMSYKMADVDNRILAYSFYESLSNFIKDIVSDINSEFKAENLILCGNMFSNSILLSKINKNIANIDVFIPKEYPIDL